MRQSARSTLVLLSVLLLAGAAAPAAADITAIMHFKFIDGDTLTRATYYTTRRVRVTAPDGREFMYNQKTDSITVIDHRTRKYWSGPRALADSIATGIMNANREGVPEMAASDPVAWADTLEAFNRSIVVEPTERRMKIAGYPCDEWVLSAGKYLHTDQWIARSLVVENYGPEVQKAVLATIKDPLGRALMRLQIGLRTKQGLALAGKTTFQTLKGQGSFEFEAVKVVSAPIPKSAWEVPAGYTAVQL